MGILCAVPSPFTLNSSWHPNPGSPSIVVDPASRLKDSKSSLRVQTSAKGHNFFFSFRAHVMVCSKSVLPTLITVLWKSVTNITKTVFRFLDTTVLDYLVKI